MGYDVGLLIALLLLPGFKERRIDFGLSGKVGVILDHFAGAGGHSRQLGFFRGVPETGSIEKIDAELA